MGRVWEVVGRRGPASVTVVLWSVLSMVLAASNTRAEKAAARVRIEKDVAYLGPDRQEKGDLYLPPMVPKGSGSPAVVIIHGGGWTEGDKEAAREINIGTSLAEHGYVGFSINYLLAKTGRPTWPQNLQDCKTAVRWLRKNADRLQIDTRHIGAIGGSAGGHLAAMLAVTGPEAGLDPKGPDGQYSCAVQAAVDLYGPADLTRWPHDAGLAMLPGSRAEKPELYKLASPVTHVSQKAPPVLILHGTADDTVPIEQSKQLADVLRKVGVPHELIVIEGAPHSFHLQPKQRDLRPLVVGFFDRYLKTRPVLRREPTIPCPGRERPL
jgi:acetyl esterase/lipase